ncbi:MAG: hypothetical protein AAF471_03235 [Myxococcota bacterium]
MLLRWANHGCEVECGTPWPPDRIRQAVRRGNHPTAQAPAAAAALRAETLEKVEEGFGYVLQWDKIAHAPPPELKVSPLGAIPHKSRAYRAILDLSFVPRELADRALSVNESTTWLAPQQAMAQIGFVLPRIIQYLADAPLEQGPMMFVKFDIKDGYWRVMVDPERAVNFAFVVPRTAANQPVELFVPFALQMGWRESVPYFCAVSETGRDVAQALVPKAAELPVHRFEKATLPPDRVASAVPTATWHQSVPWHIEVYLDDYVGMLQSTDTRHLRFMSRALLTAIHSVFPPPDVTGHVGQDPVSQKKLASEGVWCARKEVLGWDMDGEHRTISLPQTKIETLVNALRRLRRKSRIQRKELESLRGKLQHAAFGCPEGRAFLIAFHIALTATHRNIAVTQPLKEAATDWLVLLQAMRQRPIPVAQLVVRPVEFVGFCDASGTGAGGVWFSLLDEPAFPPILWRVPFPPDISDGISSTRNKGGFVTNSDLEMAGVFMAFLVLECMVDLRHRHVAIWCDNTPTVAWTKRLTANRSMIAARLLRALAYRMFETGASPFHTLSIAGVDNAIADIPSRSFRQRTAGGKVFDWSSTKLISHFDAVFPLPQTRSWLEFQMNENLRSRVYSELRPHASNRVSWRRITRTGSVIGAYGPSSSWTTSACHPGSMPRLFPKPCNCSAFLQNGFGQDPIPRNVTRSVQRQLQSRFVPSARPINWLASPTPPSRPTTSTTFASSDSSKPADEATPPLNNN